MGIDRQIKRNSKWIVEIRHFCGTHELDVARFTKRMVILRDGKIVTAEAVQPRSVAEKELQRLREEQQAVKLAS